jgi:hypothetical protein
MMWFWRLSGMHILRPVFRSQRKLSARRRCGEGVTLADRIRSWVGWNILGLILGFREVGDDVSDYRLWKSITPPHSIAFPGLASYHQATNCHQTPPASRRPESLPIPSPIKQRYAEKARVSEDHLFPSRHAIIAPTIETLLYWQSRSRHTSACRLLAPNQKFIA